MRPTVRPLWRLFGIALLAMGAAGSQALREETRRVAPADEVAPRVLGELASFPAAGPVLDRAGEDSPVVDGQIAETADSTGQGARPGAATERTTIDRVCRVTAYHDRGLTSAGVPSGLGQCAAPAYVPIGSRIHIPALGRTFVVTDRTHRRFRNSTVDLFIPCPDRCRQFGLKFLEVEITLPDGKPTRPELLRAAQRFARTG